MISQRAAFDTCSLLMLFIVMKEKDLGISSVLSTAVQVQKILCLTPLLKIKKCVQVKIEDVKHQNSLLAKY